MKHAINDKRQHSLSPYARLTVWRANNRQVGYRKVMRRVKKLFSGSGMTFEQLEQFTRSRSGRRHLKNLVYRATREHYLSIGRPLSYAVERARTARLSAGQMLKQLGLDLNMRDEYTYDALKMKPRKDTRPALLGVYVPAKNTPVLYAPSRSGISGHTLYGLAEPKVEYRMRNKHRPQRDSWHPGQRTHIKTRLVLRQISQGVIMWTAPLS